MEAWAGLAARGGREICRYDLHGNQSQVARMVAQCFTRYATTACNFLRLKNC